MKASIFVTLAAISVCGCNSISVKPGTMTPGETVYADRGGFTMARSIKTELERRGYRVVVGSAKTATARRETETGMTPDSVKIPTSVRYYVSVSERREFIRPIWCVFNGMWWWNFNVSISDQNTGEELMTWRGRGCADSSMRLLRKNLNKLETQTNEQQYDKQHTGNS